MQNLSLWKKHSNFVLTFSLYFGIKDLAGSYAKRVRLFALP